MTAYNTNNNHVSNEFYKPDWEDLHDFHAEHRDRLTKEAKEAPQEELGSDAYHKRWERISAHNKVCLRCLDTYQHKTIGDYFHWLETQMTVPDGFEDIKNNNSFQSFQQAQDSINAVFREQQEEIENREVNRMREDLENRAKEKMRNGEALSSFEKHHFPHLIEAANDHIPAPQHAGSIWNKVKLAANGLLRGR